MILKRGKVHADTSMVVAPGTRQVMRMLLEKGHLKSFIDAGARLAESACGFCIGNGHTPGTNWVSVRTNNRNYEGRCGAPDAKVYLVSPETAAATAMRGVLIDPRDIRTPAPRFTVPKKYAIDDSLIIKTAKKSKARVEQGPNIVEPPPPRRLPPNMDGAVAIKLATTFRPTTFCRPGVG